MVSLLSVSHPRPVVLLFTSSPETSIPLPSKEIVIQMQKQIETDPTPPQQILPPAHLSLDRRRYAGLPFSLLWKLTLVCES